MQMCALVRTYVPVTNTWEKKFRLKDERFIHLMISEILVHGWLALLLGAWGKAEDDVENLMGQSFLLHGSQRQRSNRKGQHLPFKGPQWLPSFNYTPFHNSTLLNSLFKFWTHQLIKYSLGQSVEKPSQTARGALY